MRKFARGQIILFCFHSTTFDIYFFKLWDKQVFNFIILCFLSCTHEYENASV
ncbi:hypothetical protein BYT27DRAFT_7203425 [Phlegmacium glaucopus]|nr:hypothetical protein BYT27DRAFT_7203425 [Phlegmacium glaucopus]